MDVFTGVLRICSLMTCIDDLDVGMTLQEYCAMVHAGLCSYCICYDGLSVQR